MDWDANVIEIQIIAFFGNHVVGSVQMCGFEGNNLADLRVDFGIFADTKHQELPGSSATFMIIDFAISYHQSAIKPSSSWLLPFQVGCATWKFIMIPKMLSASTVHCSPQLVICKGWANPRGSRVRVRRVRVRVRILWPSENPYPCEGSGGFQRLLFLKLQSTLVCVYLLNLSLNIV